MDLRSVILLCPLLCHNQWTQIYQSFFPDEKIFNNTGKGFSLYLQTDKNTYQTGEQIWFAVYETRNSEVLQETNSKVVYVVLVNDNGVINESIIVYCNNGLGNGYLNLKGNLASGRYLIKSYTSFIKNNGIGSVAQKWIEIVNEKAVKSGDVFISVNTKNKTINRSSGLERRANSRTILIESKNDIKKA